MYKHSGAEPFISRQWQRKGSPSICLPLGSHALSAEPFHLQTILGRGSRVIPFTFTSRFIDTNAGVEPFHHWTNPWQRKQSPSNLYVPLGSQTLWCWTFSTSGQYMAEEVESFHVTSASRFTDTEVVKHYISSNGWQRKQSPFMYLQGPQEINLAANFEEAESFQIHTTIRTEPICLTCRTMLHIYWY